MGFFDFFKKQPKKNKVETTSLETESKQTEKINLSPEQIAAIKVQAVQCIENDVIEEAIAQAQELSTTGNYDHALALLHEIFRLKPEMRGLCENEIGTVYLLMGENKNAVIHYLLALEHGFDHTKSDFDVWQTAEEHYHSSGDTTLLKIYLKEFPQGKFTSKAKELF